MLAYGRKERIVHGRSAADITHIEDQTEHSSGFRIRSVEAMEAAIALI